MMSSNCKVTLRADPQLTDKQNFDNLFKVFNKRVGECGVKVLYKRYQRFESKSEKIKRKKKESTLRRIKEEREMERERQ
jgi:ribosomal protein S21